MSMSLIGLSANKSLSNPPNIVTPNLYAISAATFTISGLVDIFLVMILLIFFCFDFFKKKSKVFDIIITYLFIRIFGQPFFSFEDMASTNITVFQNNKNEIIIKNFLISMFNEHGKPVQHPDFNGYIIIFDGKDFFKKENTHTKEEVFSSFDPTKAENNFSYLLNAFDMLNPYQFLDGNKIVVSKNSKIMAFTHKIGQYFDLICLVLKDGELVNINFGTNEEKAGIKHSGDIHDKHGKNAFKQHVIFPSFDGEFAIALVGYSHTLLKTFGLQNPFVVIEDGKTDIMHMFPFPLDEGTVGDSTLAIPIKGRTFIDENGEKMIEVSIIRNMTTLPNKNTNDNSQELRDAVLETFSTQTTTSETSTEIFLDESLEEFEKKTNLLPAESHEEITEGEVFHFYDESTKKIFYGFERIKSAISGGIQYNGNGIKNDGIFGPSSGHPSLLFGDARTSPDGTFPSDDQIKHSKVLLTMALEDTSFWPFSCGTKKGNGLIIFTTLETPSNIENFLIGLNIYPLTIIGQRSTILVKILDKYYYYRGNINSGFPEHEFASEVKDIEEKINQWINSSQYGDTIVDINDDTAYSVTLGRTIYPDELKDCLSIMNYEDLRNVMLQFSICLLGDKFNELVKLVVEYLTDIEEKMFVKEEREKQLNEILTGPNVSKEIIGAFLKPYNDFKRLIDFVYRLVSEKGSVSKGQTSERLKTKNVILMNVEESLKMDSGKLFEMVADNCTEHGILIAGFGGSFVGALKHLQIMIEQSEGTYNSTKLIAGNPEIFSQLTEIDPRMNVLDNFTWLCIMEIIKDKDNSLTDNSKGLITHVMTSSTDMSASWGIPLYDDFVKVTNPYTVDWKKVANDPVHAYPRINTRQILSKNRVCNFPPDNTLLGAMICMVYLDLLETMIGTRETIPTEDSSVLAIIKGMFGILMATAASGMNDQFKPYELFSTKDFTFIPSNFKELNLYVRLFRVAFFAGFVTEYTVERLHILYGKALEIDIDFLKK